MMDATRQIARTYDAVAEHYTQGYSRPINLAEDVAVKRLFPGRPDALTLDLGCGTGAAVCILGLDPSQYMGIDVSPAMVEAAPPDVRPHLLVGDFDEPGFGVRPRIMPREQVISLYALQYSQNLHDTLQGIAEHVIPGGLFFAVLCSPRHRPQRSSYITGRLNPWLPRTMPDAASVKRALMRWYASVEVLGFNCVLPAPDALAADDFSQAWEPEGKSAQSDLNTSRGVTSLTPAALSAQREQEQKVAQARTEQERQTARRESTVFHVVCMYADEEAEIVRSILGDAPALKLLDLCKWAKEHGQ